MADRFPYTVTPEAVQALQFVNGGPVTGTVQPVFTIRDNTGRTIGRTLDLAEARFAAVGREACELLRNLRDDMDNATITREALLAYRQMIGAILARVP